MMSVLGAVSQYKDYKKQFYKEYYLPYLEDKNLAKLQTPVRQPVTSKPMRDH